MLTLYDFKAAPSPRRTRIFLAEKGIEYDCKQVDLTTQEQLGDAYKAINPRCAVPALVTEDGHTITENVAIATYLEDLYPDPPLLGRTPESKAHIAEWNWRCEFEGLMAVAEILRNSSRQMQGRAMTGTRNIEQIPALADRGRQRLAYFYDDLNAHLQDNAYVAGSSYSLADITAMVCVDFSGWVKAKPDESLKALHSWHKKVSDRPSSSA